MFYLRVWALSLSTENSETGYEHNSCYTLFGVTITLTEDGLDHIFEVLYNSYVS